MRTVQVDRDILKAVWVRLVANDDPDTIRQDVLALLEPYVFAGQEDGE